MRSSVPEASLQPVGVMSSRVMKPRSHALTVASSWRPMLVGEVRIATDRLGVLLEVVRARASGSLAVRTARRSASGAARSASPARPARARQPALLPRRRRAERVGDRGRASHSADQRQRRADQRIERRAAAEAPGARATYASDRSPRASDQRGPHRAPGRADATGAIALGLRRGLPLEQLAAGDQHAPQGPDDRVDRDPRLMRAGTRSRARAAACWWPRRARPRA